MESLHALFKARIMPITLRLSVFYASLCLFAGVQLPFFPVWLRSRGLGPEEISYILAGTMFLRIVAGPTIAFVADRWDNRRRMVILVAWGALTSCSLFLVADGFWPIFLVNLLLMCLWPSMNPLIDALTMRAVAEHGIDYGRVRLWCSLSFIGASSVAGLMLAGRAPDFIIMAMVLALGVNLLGAFLLPPENPKPRRKPGGGSQALATIRLAKHPIFFLFLMTSSLIQSTHAMYYAFGTLNWQHQGFSDLTIGILWGLGTGAEIIVFALSGKIVARVGAPKLLILGALGAIIRWTALSFSPSLPITVGLQLFHALTFGAAHLGAMYFVAAAAPKSVSTTAQSLYSAMSAGVVMGLVTLAAGPLYAHFHAHAFLFMALWGVVALIGTFIIKTKWSGGVLGAETGE